MTVNGLSAHKHDGWGAQKLMPNRDGGLARRAATPSYDVFVGYQWQDHDSIEPTAQALRQGGLSVLLDPWYLTPGLSLLDRLATVLRNCRAAVMIGAQGLGGWQQRESNLALDPQTRDATLPVILVLLPGAEPALDFLGLNNRIDLQQRLGDPRLEILAKVIRGDAPGPNVQESVADMLAEICPYRALRWFRKEDARFFCGPETFIERLSESVESKLLNCRGRRSAVASLLRSCAPACCRIYAAVRKATRFLKSSRWYPGERPLLRLAAALVPLLESGTDEIQLLGNVSNFFDPTNRYCDQRD